MCLFLAIAEKDAKEPIPLIKKYPKQYLWLYCVYLCSLHIFYQNLKTMLFFNVVWLVKESIALQIC